MERQEVVIRGGDEGVNAGVDEDTHSLVTIDVPHHEIHEGESFTVSHTVTGKNDGETGVVVVLTTTKDCHVLFNWAASGAAYAKIFEGPTITDNSGTNGVSVFNRDRNSTNTSTVKDNATSRAFNKVCTDPTVSATGTVIFTEFAGAAKAFGGLGRNNNEFILAQNTEYAFVVESDAAGLTLNMILDWYEE
jgi:hypothetical protein